MAFTETAQIAVSVFFFGALSFVLGVFAELKKPLSGTPVPGIDVLICKYPSDPSVALGSLSALAALIATALGLLSVFFPYKGRAVPNGALFKSTILVVFFCISSAAAVLGVGMTLWATVEEGLQHIHNVHHALDAECGTVMTGLFGGAAFVNLDAALFWLVCQMLTMNVREDFLDYDEDDAKGGYGQLVTTDL